MGWLKDIGGLGGIGGLLGGVAALFGAAKGSKETTGKSPEINKAFDWGYYDGDDADSYSFTRSNSFYRDPNSTPSSRTWQGSTQPAGCDPTTDGLGCKFSSKRYLKYGYNRISPGAQVPDGIPDADLVRNKNGEVVGYFSVTGGTDTASQWNESHARNELKIKPFMMSQRWGEGQKFLAQRDFFNRQDQQFASRDAANQLSIRQRDQPAWNELDRQHSIYQQQTAQQMQADQWQWQQSHAQQEGDAYRARMQAMYPGASTWDLLGSSGASQGTGPGSLPGLPGAPAPSAGTLRSGPDPAIAAAKLQSSNSLMQTAVNAKLQEAQLRMQDSIAKRNAEIQFLNTAISGATGAADIFARTAAAKQALATTAQIPANADAQRRLQSSQAMSQEAQAQESIGRLRQIIPEEAHVKASQARLNQANTAAIKHGKTFEQMKNNLKNVGQNGDPYAIIGTLLGISPSSLRKLLGAFGRKGSIR